MFESSYNILDNSYALSEDGLIMMSLNILPHDNISEINTVLSSSFRHIQELDIIDIVKFIVIKSLGRIDDSMRLAVEKLLRNSNNSLDGISNNFGVMITDKGILLKTLWSGDIMLSDLLNYIELKVLSLLYIIEIE